MRREPEGAHVGVPGFVGQEQGRGEVAPKAGQGCGSGAETR